MDDGLNVGLTEVHEHQHQQQHGGFSDLSGAVVHHSAAAAPRHITVALLGSLASTTCTDGGRGDEGGGSSVFDDDSTLSVLALLYGKVFPAAVGIARHGAEQMRRIVVLPGAASQGAGGSGHLAAGGSHSGVVASASGGGGAAPSSGGMMMMASSCGQHVTPSPPPVRWCYQVGKHYIFPPTFFCSCSAFRYQVVNKGDTFLCKHVLAVLIAHFDTRRRRQRRVKEREEAAAAAAAAAAASGNGDSAVFRNDSSGMVFGGDHSGNHQLRNLVDDGPITDQIMSLEDFARICSE